MSRLYRIALNRYETFSAVNEDEESWKSMDVPEQEICGTDS